MLKVGEMVINKKVRDQFKNEDNSVSNNTVLFWVNAPLAVAVYNAC